MIDHKPTSLEDLEIKMNYTKKLWNKEYPWELYNLKTAFHIRGFVSSFKYDIEAASERQKLFYYQVEFFTKIFSLSKRLFEGLFASLQGQTISKRG